MVAIHSGHTMNGLKKAGAIFDNITGGLWFAAGIFLLFIMLSVIADVILRGVSDISLTWVMEVSEYMLFALTFFGVAWCLKIGGHVRIDFIFNMLKQRAQVILGTVTSVLGTMMCLAYAYYAGQATWLSIERGTHLIKFLKVPKYTFSSIMCVCALLLTIEFMRLSYKYFRMWRAGSNEIETQEVS